MSDGCLKGIAYGILTFVVAVATFAAYAWVLMLLVGVLHLQLGMFSGTIGYWNSLGLGLLLWLFVRALVPPSFPTKKKPPKKEG